MFGQMIADLKNGKLPDNNLLSKRFAAALVKKLAVIRTPYSLWPADPKINPPAKQLLWAAILLHDKENYQIVEAIIAAELEERLRAKGRLETLPHLAAEVQQLLQEFLQEFIALAPDESFREKLRIRAKEFFPVHQDE